MYEMIAFAVLYVVEAIVAVLYLEYLYERKRKNWKLSITLSKRWILPKRSVPKGTG